MAQGLERIPLAVDSDFQAQPVRANFPDAPAQDYKLVSFEPDQIQAQPEPQPRSLGTVAADTAYGMAKGAGSLAKGIGWLTGSDNLQQWGQTAEDYWGEKQSAEIHRQLDEVGKAEGVSGTVASLWNNPGAIGDYIATSLPMMIPGMAVGNLGARGIIAYAGNAARGAALRAGATEAAAMQAGRIAAEKAAEKAAMRFAVGANMLGEGAVSGGVTGAEVEKFALEHGATPEQAKAAANKSALMAGAWTTAGAGIGAGMETRAMLGRLKDSGIKGMVKNVAKEAAEEAIQNPGEDYAAYAGKVQFDPTQTFDPGKAATLGAVTGGAMGAGFHAAGRAGTIMRGEREDDNPDGAIPADDIGAGPGSGGPGAIEGTVLGPEQIADQRGGPITTRQPETYTQITPTVLPRLALPAPEAGGPSDRQVSTAIGLLKHSPKASPELLQRLMRVDQTMATMLFNHWQGQTNGQVTGNQATEIPAAGDQGQGTDIAGSRVMDGFSDGAVSFIPGAAAEDAALGGESGMAMGGAGPDAVTPLDVQAHAAATSPFNNTPQPTEAQKQAGNYKVGRIKFQGMDISIENPAGSVRSGTDEDGKAWETQIQHHYGYIKGTVGKDKDHLDVFIKPGAQSARTAYVIDQINPKTGGFDEHKIVFGADSEADAQAIYHANYEQGWQGMGAITAMPIEQFKDWIKSGKTKKPVAYTEPKEFRTASRTPKAANSLLQAIVNRGGISREIMSDVGADPAGRYMPGLFTKTGTTDLSALAGYLFDEDGFHQIRQDSDIGPARELEDLIVRALSGEKIISTAAMEKSMQAEETAKLKEKAQRLGVKTVARKLEDIAADVAQIEERNILDEETRLEDEALVAYNEAVDALNAAIGEDATESFLEDLASRYQDETHLNYLRSATIALQEKLNAQVQSAGKPDETAAGQAGPGDEAGRAQGGTDSIREEARPTLSLSGQSEAEIRAEQERVAAAEAQRKAEDERAVAAERQARIDAEVAGRQDVAADNFTLTPQVNNKTQQKKADQAEIDRQLAGQGDIFGSNSENQPAAPVAESNASPMERDDAGVAPGQDGAAAERKTDAKGNPIYRMGERVEYVSGGYAGRHGAISQVTPMVTTVLGLARDTGYYAQNQSTSYYYHVKTDNGADFMASPEEIRFETAKPDSVVPDITVDGMVMEPRRVLDGIGYAKRSAEGSRAAAQRARKASAIADHKRAAERNDAKADQYQAAWDAWAAKYPTEAEKIAPAAKQAATPAQSSATGTAGDPAAVLKAAGLVVTKGTTNNGKPVWNVSGNTKTHMDIIKRAGGRWYGPKKVWSFYNDDPSAAIAAKLPQPGPTIAGTPTIAMSDKGLQQIAASNQPAAAKAKAELEARDQAGEVDLGQLFDEVLAEETGRASTSETAQEPRTMLAAENEPQWWRELTGYERYWRLGASGIPGTASTPWARFTAEQQQALNRQWAPRQEPRTAGQAAASAAINTGKGLLDAIDGLGKLFGSNGSRLSMGISFDDDTYAKAKPLFAQAVAHFKDAGADLKEAMRAVVRMVLDKFGPQVTDNMKPYIVRFMEDVRDGKIDYAGIKEADNGLERNEDQAPSAGNQGSGNRVHGSPGQADQGGLADQPAENVGSPGEAWASGRSGVGTPDGDVGRDGSVRKGGDAANGRQGTGGTRVADAGTGGRGRSGEQSVGGTDGGNQPGTLPVEGSRAEVGNYHIADPEQLIGGTPKVRFARNRKAIEALQSIQGDGRQPTADELDAMAGYIGWGSFGQELFQGTYDRPRPKAGWEKESDWLREHLGKEAWESAQASIINAHYTDPITVSTMWDMVRQMGFTGGRVLEPSMGVGNFFGLMPRDLMARSKLSGIEMDTTTGGMAKLLYPDANIQIKPYQDSKTADNFYDLVIGNWPFAKDGPADRRYLKLSPSLHDFFFLKALDQTRPGGLVVGITSAGTMDKQGTLTRAAIAEKADLVAAFRLPTGAFEKYAGTSVVTDIIILKKRETPNADVRNSGWLTTIEVDTPSGNKVKVNEYFANNPSKVLGTLNFGHGTTYGRPAMIVDRPADLESRMGELAATLPEGVFEPTTTKAKTIQYVTNNTKDRQQSIIRQDGKLFQVQGEYLAPLHEVHDYRVKDAKKTADREAQLGKLIDMRRKHGALIDAERDGLEDVETRRKALNDAYKAFTKSHGPLADSEGMAIMRRVGDPFFPALAALEVGGKPATILSRATMRTKKKLENPSVRDALIMMRNESVFIDMARVAAIAGVSEDVAAKELLEAGAVFQTPEGTYDVSDVYLSGNVRRKLREAEAAAEAGMNMERNIAALKRVIPADVPYFNIEAKLGATWVPPEYYKQFIEHMLGTKSDGIEARFVVNRWKVRFGDRSLLIRSEAQTTWGTPWIHFNKLVEHAMGNMAVKIWGKDADGNKVVDEKASAEANEKANKIREEFGNWLWSDPVRKIEMERAYNEVMNAIAKPLFDGSFMTFEGMALQRGNSPFDMRSHQGNAVYRGLVNRRGIYAHEVGTGKTYTMGALAVESRRYGIAKKPLIFAHNANSSSVAREIGEQYPGAKVLYIDNLAPDRIDVTMRQIANDEWDAIVVPHSLISRFALKEETLMEISRHEIEALEQEAIDAANDDGIALTVDMMDDEDAMKKVRSHTAKQLVHGRNQIIKKVKEMALKSSKEGAVSFEDMGIDMIIVDEAHEFKKPPLATRMSMKGLNKTASNQSISLMFLTDYVKKLNGGTGVHVFTGTPITNTINEIYNMMRFVMDDQMSRDGVREWDAWFNTFADQTSDVELTPAGEYEPVSRLASFVNVPELRRMAGQYMDIVFADDMPEFNPRETKSGKTLASENLTDAERAELLNGRTEAPIGRPYKKIINDVAEMSPEQVVVFDELKRRAASFKAASKKERKEIMLSGDNRNPVIVETAAANAGLDARLYDMEAGDSPDSKVNRAVKNVLAHYKEHDKATQVIFVDKGYTSESVSRKKDRQTGQVRVEKKPRFNFVRDIVAKLTEQGIPLNQIAIVDGSVSKDKRKEIADAMNESRIRVVIGQTDTLGVGVNMQVNLRAMHHMDAPWMPGELEQRNGRGHRQGNKWNTVLEYRYITERIDGRRWQVLSIKERFIKSFLKADDSVRVIEGDAVSLDEDGDLGNTLSDAAGDPRLLLMNKLRSDVQKLENRERMHAQGIFDAKREIGNLKDRIERVGKALANYRKDSEKFRAVAKDELVIEVGGRKFADAEKANEAMELVASKVKVGADPIEIANIWGFTITAAQPVSWRGIEYHITGAAMHQMGKPTVESARATMYGVAKRAEGMEADIAEWTDSIPRMEEATKAPFARAKDLDKKRKMLADIEIDIQNNPVPAPAWLRNGTPAGTEVFADGKPLVVEGHRYTNDGYYVTVSDGDTTRDIDYMEAKDENGLPKYEEREFEAPKIIKADKVAGAATATTDTAYSEGEAMSASEITQTIADFVEKLGHKPPVIVVETADEIGAGFSEQVRGAVFKGRIYIVRTAFERGNTAAVVRTLWHELLHYGLRRFLTEADYTAKMLDLFKRDGWVRNYARHWMSTSASAKRMRANGRSEDYITARGVDEALAYLSERNTGGTENGFMKNGLIDRAYRAVTTWLADVADQIGMPESVGQWLRHLKNVEARQYVHDMLKRVENDSPATSGDWAFTADAAFSGGKKGMESRSRSTGFASTESTRAIQSIVNKFLKQFAGAADLDIRVVRTVADIPERFRPSPFAEGVFNDDAGLIYLVAMNLKHANGQVNAGRVWQVLMHEAVGHFGLAQMMGGRFGGILKEVMRAAKAKGGVGEDIYEPGHPDYATIEAVKLRYPGASDKELAQEVLARMAETDPGRTLFGYARAVVRQWLRDMARAAGITLDVTTAELNDLVAQASRYMRRGDGVAHGVDVDALGVADMAVGGMASKATGMESRRAPGAAKPKEPRTGILDTILRKAGGELAAKITGPAYDKLTAYLGGKVPEGIKAGMVSDYGLDESYVDRRTGMQTEQQKAARQTKTFVEGLMDLDRAQSRVAYQWLNNRGAEADRLMAQLPQESQQVLKDIKIQIAKLTIEAVRLGQLDAETASRNFLAYLHRSYAKYDLNTDDKTWKAERAKAIKILGDQYKGRGLKMDVDPDRIHSAPGWWQDEMKGKRVQVLKNDAGRFAFVAEGTAIPPNLSGYKVEGVWEIRARKAADRITLWRDFTQDERQMMGELDEAKYAVARTLFMMNRDIEVGRFHEWVADEYAKTPEEAEEEGLQMADASDSMMRAFKPDEWVTVPTTKVTGAGVFKYGALAGMVVPGPVWNDIRQISAGRFEPFGAAYASILRAWKLSKTALTPTTHVNNIMGNFVMADMHDVGARDAIAAVRLMVAAANGDKDAKAMLDRFEDSGATQGMFTTHELKKEVLEPLLQQLREEVGMADDEAAILKVSAIMSLALHGKFGEAWAGAKAAAKQSTAGRATGAVVTKAQDYYQAEDSVFRLAAFLKSVDEGKTDLEAGKLARKAFLDYHINAPWINAMRGTAMPFIAFAYRAIPMLTETAAKKPWKIAKYMLVAGGLNALAYAMLGADADEDKERAYLPEEKAGRLWGIVPKLIRMPWNRESKLRDGKTTSDPVFLDVRRWIPVGDVVDYGQDKTALPMIPQPLIPGGPLIMAAEFLVNKSAFTGKELTKETDTWVEKAAKVGGHFYKGFMPNVPIPYSGTWAGTKIDNAVKGKEDPLGRAYPVPEAIASGFGLKFERYPVDTLQRNAVLDMKGKLRELSDAQRQAARDYGRQGMTKRELDEKVTEIVGKKNATVEEYKVKERKAMGKTAP